MQNFNFKQNYDIADLKKIVSLLRDPVDGCPWDKVQTHSTIRQNFIEETYEVCDAIDAQNDEMLCEELGDVLLQVMLHTQFEAEKNSFDFDKVCDGICKKLIYRHPHIFSDTKVNGTTEVLKNWDKLKEKEKSLLTASDNLNAVPNALPALMKSKKLQKRAGEYGFKYDDVNAAFADLDSEIAELKQAIVDKKGEKGEIGDVLFSVVNVARMLNIDAEEALSQCSDKFKARVIGCEEIATQNGKSLKDMSKKELDDAYKLVKLEKQDK
ncbi:MAG: nucleoside triphosphate pyrophosphohydrolase [Oscillospiraceae bacterium]